MTVEERLEALEKEVQQLKDVQAIEELKSKYLRALDTKRWDELETTMTPDVSAAFSSPRAIPTAARRSRARPSTPTNMSRSTADG